jgi:colanic acid/amylovoran biosynthesis glycosyltransferase
MRILIVVGEFPAISETFVLDQITGLMDLGHQVDVLARQPRSEKMVHSQVEQYQLNKNVYYAYTGSKVGALPFVAKKLCSQLSRGNIRLLLGAARATLEKIVKKRTPLSPFQLYTYGSALLEIPRPDVVVCHFGHQGNLMVKLRSIMALDFPVATIFHGADITEFIAVFGDRAYDELFDKGQLFLPVSNFFVDRLLQLGCPVSKTFVQRMGIDQKLFPPSREGTLGENFGDFKFLSIGRLVEKKGHADAITAFGTIKRKYSDVGMTLNIIGDGPLRKDLEARIEELEIKSCVNLLGPLPREKVFQHLATSHAFILASVTSSSGDMEGLPVSILEAMTFELPIISTKHSGIPEIVEDGVSGFLAEEHDVETLAVNMGKLIEERELCRKMGKAGRARILSEMNLEAWNDLLASRLEKISNRVPVGSAQMPVRKDEATSAGGAGDTWQRS